MALEQRSCYCICLPWLVKVAPKLSVLPGLAVVSVTELILHISFGSIAGTVMPFDASHCKKKQKTSCQCAAILWESYSCCFVRLEILLDMLQSPSVWVTIGRKLLQVSRVPCSEGGDGVQLMYPNLVACREMEDVVKFWVILCNSYFIPSDLCQKYFRLWLFIFQSLRSQNE